MPPRSRPRTDKLPPKAVAVGLLYATNKYRTHAEIAAAAGCHVRLVPRYLALPQIQALVAAERGKAARKVAVTAERVRAEILADTLAAREAGDYRTAIAGWKDLGRDLGMWPDKLTLEATLSRAPDDLVREKVLQAMRSGALEALLARPARALPAEEPHD